MDNALPDVSIKPKVWLSRGPIFFFLWLLAMGFVGWSISELLRYQTESILTPEELAVFVGKQDSGCRSERAQNLLQRNKAVSEFEKMRIGFFCKGTGLEPAPVLDPIVNLQLDAIAPATARNLNTKGP